jgi:hypothetical protein
MGRYGGEDSPRRPNGKRHKKLQANYPQKEDREKQAKPPLTESRETARCKENKEEQEKKELD